MNNELYWTGATAAFAAELAALGSFAAWGLALSESVMVRIVAAVGIPVAAATLWALFASPRATFDVPWLAIGTRILVFGGAVSALAATRHPRIAIALGALILLGALLTSLAPLPTEVD